MKVPNLNILSRRSKQKELDLSQYQIIDIDDKIVSLEKEISLSVEEYASFYDANFNNVSISSDELNRLIESANGNDIFNWGFVKESPKERKTFFEELVEFIDEFFKDSPRYDSYAYKSFTFNKNREKLLKERYEELINLRKQLKRIQRYLSRLIHSGIENVDLRNNFRKKVQYIYKRLDSEHSISFNY